MCGRDDGPNLVGVSGDGTEIGAGYRDTGAAPILLVLMLSIM
jgi:hypothetical protein